MQQLVMISVVMIVIHIHVIQMIGSIGRYYFTKKEDSEEDPHLPEIFRCWEQIRSEV
jgi:hypothetical protein